MSLPPWALYADGLDAFNLGAVDQSTPQQPSSSQQPISAVADGAGQPSFAASGGSSYASSSTARGRDTPDGQGKGPSLLSRQSTGPGQQYSNSHDHENGTANSADHTGTASEKEKDAAAPSSSLRRGMACSFCRRRKLKCSGEKPKCTSCIKYNQQCEYGQTGKPKPCESRTTGEQMEYLRNTTASITQPGRTSSSFDSVPLTNAASIDNSTSWGNYLNLPNSDILDGLLPSHNQSMFPLGSQQSDFQPFGNPPQMDFSSPFDHSTLSTFGHVASLPASSSHMLYDGATQQPNAPMDFTSSGPSQALGRDSALPTFTAPFPPLPTTSTNSSYNSSYNSPESGQDLTNAQQKASASRYFRTSRIASQSQSQSSPARSGSETPDRDGIVGPPLSSTINSSTPDNQTRQAVNPRMLYGNIPSKHVLNITHIDPIDGITESLGEFLFDPVDTKKGGREGSASATGFKETPLKKRRGGDGMDSHCRPSSSVVLIETDGLEDGVRNLLLDCFLAHSRLFFEMSIPRFRYRMTFQDRRRPAPALLYAMYLWATRISNETQQAPLEQHFFTSACSALDISCANGDRLMDCLRAAMLLASYTYTTGRYHEGWILSGLACRLVLSTGIHQIPSCVFSTEAPRDTFLRGQAYLLPPPEDAMDLAERISTFWSIIAVDRCAALATGFPVGIRDDSIITPFPHPITDIASRLVTQQDDFTVRDLYRPGFLPCTGDQPFTTWIKAVIILERASKLAFLDPDETSNYAIAWNNYFIQSTTNPSLSPPPAWLDQPKHRSPTDYATTKLGLEQLIQHLGEEGVYPLDRKRQAELEGTEMPTILPHTVLLHQMFCATEMFLHDINAPCAANEEALVAARKAIDLMRKMPAPHRDTDAFIIMVWSIIAKVLAKEIRRLILIGEEREKISAVKVDMESVIEQMGSIGVYMQLARSQARALSELKRLALESPLSTAQASPEADGEEYYHCEPSRPSDKYQGHVHVAQPPPRPQAQPHPQPPPPQPQPQIRSLGPDLGGSIHGAAFDSNWPDPS